MATIESRGPGEDEEDTELCQHRPRPWAAATRDMDMGSVDQHELISFLDDTDTDADEFILPCPSPLSSSSAPVAYALIDNRDEDDDEIDGDPTTTADFSNSSTCLCFPARSSFSSTTLTAITTTASTATATTTTATMAPITIANSFLSKGGGGGGDAKSDGKTTTVAETAAGRRLTVIPTADSATDPLRTDRSHEKSSSNGSKKTMATPTTIQAMRETLSSAGSATIVPPPVSPSTGSFGAEMTKQEFEALPEAIQRKPLPSAIIRFFFRHICQSERQPSSFVGQCQCKCRVVPPEQPPAKGPRNTPSCLWHFSFRGLPERSSARFRPPLGPRHGHAWNGVKDTDAMHWASRGKRRSEPSPASDKGQGDDMGDG
ncbi:LOW QUALITY PROTEIN: mucin [Colletotrichum tofieldiae]|nr:LOW QUALITY PROTEIN: mucin [Colletotrichum tofieldiae]GKT75384.1 LOW QUALITY PROTEIN: mucin [Colletotrichum tofieldiae]